jgi:PAS domain S-box-containing protein
MRRKSKTKSSTDSTAELRQRAEARLDAGHDAPVVDREPIAADSLRLIHELQVHQIELELQNEELLHARSELEESLARYSDLYEFAPVGYLTLDQVGGIRQLNLTGTRLLGQDRARLLGSRMALLVTAESRRILAAFLARVFETRTTQACDLVLARQGAEALTVQVTATASLDGQECRAAVTDITARRRAEELTAVHLRLQEFSVTHSISELLQQALDEVEQLTRSEIAFYHFVDAHRHALSLQAWSTRTLAQTPIAQERGRLFDVDKAGAWAECLLRRRAVIHNDAAILRNASELLNGHARVVRELLVPVFRDGQVVAIVGVGNAADDYTSADIDAVGRVGDMAWELVERKRAAQDREALQAELVQAQKMEAIGTLAGGVAHDFNNILHGILGGLSLLEIDRSVERRGAIQDMKALVERGAELARQLLGFARRGKYDVEPLDLGSVLEKAATMFERTRGDVSIQLEVAPGLKRVLMDHTQLEHALLNLLVNAGHAMLDGGRLRLRAENVVLANEVAQSHRVQPGGFVKLVVSDTGVGMDAATQARIFEPFFTTKERGRGSGLGLASVYGIVESHGGFITVESQLEVGTTFTLFLPATDRASVPPKHDGATVQNGSGTILVVDDEEMVLRVCVRLLRSLGYDVLTASSGKQCIELVREHTNTISLVILDMMMPVMSGRDTYHELRKVAPELKVLLASGFSLEGQAQDLLALGCSGFIQKPFGLAVLSAAVQEVLSAAPSLAPPCRAD